MTTTSFAGHSRQREKQTAKYILLTDRATTTISLTRYTSIGLLYGHITTHILY
jgi:hypothetical protein